MTSTPVVLLLKRSGQSSDRPSGTVIQNGELAIAVGAADPGLYFEDSAGAVRKIGPSHYGTTAPNSTPVGLTGNSVGELWADSSTAAYYLKVWTGSAWQKVGAAFADTATTATSASTAGTATFANSADSAVIASGALTAIIASGSLTSILASGSIIASGALVASGSLTASGAILASGSRTAILSSGAILASGVVKNADVGLSGLPSPTAYGSGYMFYQIQTSGIYPAGLYIQFSNTWTAV
jgi:hypothetical protein